jgi:hypothetical protein
MDDESSTPETKATTQESLKERRALAGWSQPRYPDLASNIAAYHPDLAEFDAQMDALYDM